LQRVFGAGMAPTMSQVDADSTSRGKVGGLALPPDTKYRHSIVAALATVSPRRKVMQVKVVFMVLPNTKQPWRLRVKTMRRQRGRRQKKLGGARSGKRKRYGDYG